MIDQKKYIHFFEIYIERLIHAFKKKNNTEIDRNGG